MGGGTKMGIQTERQTLFPLSSGRASCCLQALRNPWSILLFFCGWQVAAIKDKVLTVFHLFFPLCFTSFLFPARFNPVLVGWWWDAALSCILRTSPATVAVCLPEGGAATG